jgi:hypothetical protein
VEIEAVEVDTLGTLDLLDVQDLTSVHLEGLAGAGLNYMLENDFICTHRQVRCFS